MHGIILFVIMSLGVMFVMAPLGLFVWVGLPTDAVLFEKDYWILSCFLILIYYVANFWLLTFLPKIKRKWMIGIAIFVIWLIGLFGFFNAYQDVLARFNKSHLQLRPTQP